MRNYIPKKGTTISRRQVLEVARSYYSDLNKIKQIENSLIMATSKPEADGGRSFYVSDPTYNIAQQIEKHTAVLRSRTDAVERALHKFDKDKQEIIKQNILKGTKIIYCNTTLSERSVQRIRDGFLSLLEIELENIF